MNRMRNTLPSIESQKPSTAFRSLPSAFENHPLRAASRNGFGASGLSMWTATSTKSQASTVSAGREKETAPAAHVAEEIKAGASNPTQRNRKRAFMILILDLRAIDFHSSTELHHR